MFAVESLIENLAAVTVEENENQQKEDTADDGNLKPIDEEEKVVSFAGQGLKLDTEVDAENIVDAIKSCPGMTTLELQGNTMGIPAAKAVAKALENQPLLKKAIWKDLFTQRTVDEIPQALSFLSSGIQLASATLVVLDLSDNAFGPRGLIGIVKLLESSSCYTLQELHLNNNGLGIQGAKMLADAMCKCVENSRKNGNPLSLKVFVCGRNRLENEGATAIAKFFKMVGTLESVAMPQNGIYAPGIKHLANAFASNPNLSVINLEDNSLTEDGAKYIADCLPSLKNINMLNFGDCLIRTKGAISLAESLKLNCPLLRELYLGFNEINKEGGMAIVDAMAEKNELEMLVLNGNIFGIEGCEDIQGQMKKLALADKLGTLSEDEGDENEEEEDDDDDDYEDVEDEESDSGNECENGSIEDANKKTHQSPMSKTTPTEFVSKPTSAKLVALQKSKEDLLSVLPDKSTLDDYLNLFYAVCSVVKPGDDASKEAALKYVDDILKEAIKSCDIIEFNNSLLVCIGLIKGEDKKRSKDMDISGALLVLQHAVKQPYFPDSARDLLKFFLSRPLSVFACEKTKHSLLQILYQI